MEKQSKKELEVAYRQISVFIKGTENPFSNWTKEHIDQGFTWRSDAIGFMTINQSGKIKIDVDSMNKINESALRAYILPFNIHGSKGIEIATIIDGYGIIIPDGEYSLLFQIGTENKEKDWCSFSFIKSSELDSTPRIIRADPEITKRDSFILKADIA
jgi:hypothetical protein